MFDFDVRVPGKEELQNSRCRHHTCELCPLKQYKKAERKLPESVEILLITLPTRNFPITSEMVGGHSIYHTLEVECLPAIKIETQDKPQKKNDDAATSPVTRQCCLGRKLALIEKLKPKIVIVTGYKAFADLEDVFDHDVATGASGLSTDGVLFPTEYKGHKFWLMSISPFNTYYRDELDKYHREITQACHTEPLVLKADFKGIEYATTEAQVDAAFNDLMKSKSIGLDIETNGLKVYRLKKPKILTLALGSQNKTFGIPMQHRQSPIKPVQVLNRLWELSDKRTLIMHHGEFDLEWLIRFMGIEFAFRGRIEDTEAQAHLLSRMPKTLDALVRKFLGFSLKRISNIDTECLDDYPLERVLSYNCLDTKYTRLIWYIQQRLLLLHGLQTEEEAQLTDSYGSSIYEMQVFRIPALCVMQAKGMKPNHEAIKKQISRIKNRIAEIDKLLKAVPEVQEHIVKYGQFQPLSNHPTSGDVPLLYKRQLGVPDDHKGFDNKFLSEHPHPVSRLILDYREADKLYGTYLAPLDKDDEHQNAGKYISPDGRIHTTFNSKKVITGRLSSEDPNGQNYPKDETRDVIDADDGCKILSVDLGQIEYRLIATISGDEEIIKAILNDLDIHMSWAVRLMEVFPNQWVKEDNDAACVKKEQPNAKCPCKKCCIKRFRADVKNCWTFPLCFGAGNDSVAKYLSLPERYKGKFDKLIQKEFWDKHTGVKRWHESLRQQIRDQGYVQNVFGRRYYEPLGPNDIINYPIQGSNGDLMVHRGCELTRQGVETGDKHLIPFLNVHDELDFYVPKDQVDEYAIKIVRVILNTKGFDEWLHVPLIAEASVGPAWGSMSEFAVYDSRDFIPGGKYAI